MVGVVAYIYIYIERERDWKLNQVQFLELDPDAAFQKDVFHFFKTALLTWILRGKGEIKRASF
jgi:hypothetical protein